MKNDELMNEFGIDSVINELKENRKIFVSEADFQLSMACVIERMYPQAKVRLEYCPCFNDSMHIDILVLWGSDDKKQWIPIELKYKTKKIKHEDDDGCVCNLKDQSAQDWGCYDYFKDIERIETISEEEQFKEGYAIFLTNDSYYISGRVNEGSKHANFILSGGDGEPRRINAGQIDSQITKRPNPIQIKNNYDLKWKQYSDIGNGGKNNKFSILVVRIPPRQDI